MKRITVVVFGRVQNVGYRAKVIGFANAFEMTGFVQNLDDGRVRIIAEGEDGDLDRFLYAIMIKNHLIDVKDVKVEHADATGEFANFYKLVGGGETDERLDKASEYLKAMIVLMKDGFRDLNYATAKSIELISTQRQERLLLFEKEMLSDMHENFERYDSALQKALESVPYEKSVFIMMPFEENDIRLKKITDTIKETLEEHGLDGERMIPGEH